MSYYEMYDIENCLDNTSENPYYLVTDKGILIGCINIQIESNVGIFDIGLCKEYRGAGYGKRLLETAIDILNKAKVDDITLVVIEKLYSFKYVFKKGFCNRRYRKPLDRNKIASGGDHCCMGGLNAFNH